MADAQNPGLRDDPTNAPVQTSGTPGDTQVSTGIVEGPPSPAAAAAGATSTAVSETLARKRSLTKKRVRQPMTLAAFRAYMTRLDVLLVILVLVLAFF